MGKRSVTHQSNPKTDKQTATRQTHAHQTKAARPTYILLDILRGLRVFVVQHSPAASGIHRKRRARFRRQQILITKA
jgi:hypothetical protein